MLSIHIWTLLIFHPCSLAYIAIGFWTLANHNTIIEILKECLSRRAEAECCCRSWVPITPPPPPFGTDVVCFQGRVLLATTFFSHYSYILERIELFLFCFSTITNLGKHAKQMLKLSQKFIPKEKDFFTERLLHVSALHWYFLEQGLMEWVTLFQSRMLFCQQCNNVDQ